jgi:CxxC motif-containing protein
MNNHQGKQERISHYLCIGCPLGCRLEVEEDEAHNVVEVRGFSCKRGDAFARQEHHDPRRMVSSTVAIDNAYLPRLPVHTRDPIAKASVLALCQRLREVQVKAPVRRGQVVLSNALDLGIDVLASRTLLER